MDSHPAQHKENSPHPAQHKGTAPVHHQKMHPNPHNEPISPDRFKRYVKHICFMAKKHQQRDQSHDELEDKIKELKKVASSKKNINKEMNELKQKMDTVILHEKKISTPHQDPSQQQEMVQQAAKTVLEMKKHMGHLQKQVDAHLKDQKQLQESNKDLKAIIPLPEKDQKISEMKQHLSKLEEIYELYKDSGSNNLDRIKLKIESLRARLAVA
jgi:DNA repair ATPase RecN|tara:strand:+ start:108 stop:746 length:639 start_codon:yes stop_codon:yes gene_type:complete